MNSDTHFNLIVERKSSFPLMVLNTELFINGNKISQLSNGAKIELQLLRANTTITLRTPVFGGRSPIREVVIDPGQSEIIAFTFYHKLIWWAILPPICFYKKTASIEYMISSF